MKLRTFTDIWRKLDANQKKDLCSRCGAGYKYMRCVVFRESCSRYLAKAIAAALYDMGVVDGEKENAYERVFPEQIEDSSAA